MTVPCLVTAVWNMMHGSVDSRGLELNLEGNLEHKIWWVHCRFPWDRLSESSAVDLLLSVKGSHGIPCRKEIFVKETQNIIEWKQIKDINIIACWSMILVLRQLHSSVWGSLPGLSIMNRWSSNHSRSVSWVHGIPVLHWYREVTPAGWEDFDTGQNLQSGFDILMRWSKSRTLLLIPSKSKLITLRPNEGIGQLTLGFYVIRLDFWSGT